MLHTQRLRLRNLCRDDAERMAAYRNEDACRRYQRYEAADAEALGSFGEQFSRCRFLSLEEEQHYAVCLHDGHMIGDLSVFFTKKDNCFTLGITIAPEHQRHGYGYELLAEAVRLLRQRHPGRELVALIEPENAASIRLFRKLGFEEECYAESIGSCVFVLYPAAGE